MAPPCRSFPGPRGGGNENVVLPSILGGPSQLEPQGILFCFLTVYGKSLALFVQLGFLLTPGRQSARSGHSSEQRALQQRWQLLSPGRECARFLCTSTHIPQWLQLWPLPITLSLLSPTVSLLSGSPFYRIPFSCYCLFRAHWLGSLFQ